MKVTQRCIQVRSFVPNTPLLPVPTANLHVGDVPLSFPQCVLSQPLAVSPHAMTSAAETSPILPQELCDAIIDNIGSLKRCPPFIEVWWEPEPQTLMRCTLVCRAWRLRAQFWLFRYVRLGSFSALSKLEAHLSVHDEYLHRVQGIQISFASSKGYPFRNLATAVTTLSRRCPNLRVFSLYNVMASGVDSSKSHSCLPFHSASTLPFTASHSALSQTCLSA